MSNESSVKAVKRFGLGSRPDELSGIGSDPRGYVLGQLSKMDAAIIGESLPSAAEAFGEFQRFRVERRSISKQKQADAGKKTAAGETEAMLPKAPRADVAEIRARVQQGVRTGTPMVERLVGFWSNHLCVSSKKNGLVRAVAGAYEREAIRPHVLGRFKDMLRAAIQHPAMLLYLDNARSIGPNSRVGQKREKGLNENLAREVLELHTLGANGGYSQADVTSFAKTLTGWTYWGPEGDEPGQFRFDARRHEPGAQTIMGRRYAEGGVEQAEAILDDLAAHPKTAEHLARKLARYFVSESAPQPLVDRLAKTFLDTQGDLRQVTEALVSSDEAWASKPVKLLPPYDLMIASFRATGVVPKVGFVNRTLDTFGQPMWGVGSPAGWPDGDMAWASPDAILERVDWADQAAGEIGDKAPADVVGLARDILGDTLADVTRQTLSRAESRRQALAVLFLSSEFQRR